MFSYICPHCGLQTQVASQYAGMSGPCAGCGKPITVPGAGTPSKSKDPRATSRNTTIAMLSAAAGAILLGGILVASLLAAFFLSSATTTRAGVRQRQCANNLRQIGLAMKRYHEVHGCYPPAYVTDEKGRPMHSWRVLLLPFLEQHQLYQRYDLSKPWDSPENLQLASQMPDVYACPDATGAAFGETGYQVITGPQAVFDADKKTRMDQISDGPANTILVVESAVEVNWLEPSDWNMKSARRAKLAAGHPAAATNVLMADGSVRQLVGPLSLPALKAMATIDGREPTGSQVADF